MRTDIKRLRELQAEQRRDWATELRRMAKRWPYRMADAQVMIRVAEELDSQAEELEQRGRQ